MDQFENDQANDDGGDDYGDDDDEKKKEKEMSIKVDNEYEMRLKKVRRLIMINDSQ